MSHYIVALHHTNSHVQSCHIIVSKSSPFKFSNIYVFLMKSSFTRAKFIDLGRNINSIVREQRLKKPPFEPRANLAEEKLYLCRKVVPSTVDHLGTIGWPEGLPQAGEAGVPDEGFA